MASLRPSAALSTVDSPLQFQSTTGLPVPLGLGFAHPTSSGESLDRVLGVGAEPTQAQDTPVGGPEVAQPPSVLRRPRVSFTASAGPDLSDQEPEDEEDDNRDSVLAPPAIVKTYDRLINYVYDQYSESRPLSDYQAPPCCTFEDYFAISDLQAASRPKLRVYPRVDELIVQSQDRADKLAKEAQPLQRVITLRHRLFPVADDPDFATLRWLNPNFARLAGNKSIP